jgi:hypothetical protein
LRNALHEIAAIRGLSSDSRSPEKGWRCRPAAPA